MAKNSRRKHMRALAAKGALPADVAARNAPALHDVKAEADADRTAAVGMSRKILGLFRKGA